MRYKIHVANLLPASFKYHHLTNSWVYLKYKSVPS